MNDSKYKLAERTLTAARAALENGRQVEARKMAQQATKLAPEKEDGWLLLAYLSEPHEGIQYIQKALQIHPASLRARQAIHYLLKKTLEVKTVSIANRPSSQTEKTQMQLEMLQKELNERLLEEKAPGGKNPKKRTENVITKENIENKPNPDTDKDAQELWNATTEVGSNEFGEKKQGLITELPPIKPETASTHVESNEQDLKSYDTLISEEKSISQDEINDESNAAKTESVDSESSSNLEKVSVVQSFEQPEDLNRYFLSLSKGTYSETDPVIILLCLLGIVVLGITLFVLIKYTHLIG
jgi:hypothetical protein